MFCCPVRGTVAIVARWRSAKQERAHAIAVMRAERMSWVDIATEFEHRFGVNRRVAMRLAHGWSQAEVAKRWCRLWPDHMRTASNISSWERWPTSGHEPSLVTLSRLAEIYECDVADLVNDVGCFRHLDGGRDDRALMVTVREPAQPDRLTVDPEVDPMDLTRRKFAAGTAALLSSVGLPDVLKPVAAASPIIGADQLRQLGTAIEQLERDDATVGGGSILETASALHTQVTTWIADRSYSSVGVGEGLRDVAGELCQWRGWLAFDAERLEEARHATEQAIVHARLADDPVLETQALNCMCQLLIRDADPVGSLDCAQAAQRASRGWATPRLSALLHMRAARAYASLGERRSFSREVANARAQLDRGADPEDPLFVQFVTPQEVASIEGLAWLALDQPDRATAALTTATADPVERPRNHAYYTVWQAVAASRQHDLYLASETGLSAIQLVGAVDSPRTSRPLAALRQRVEPHRTSISVADEFARHYDEVLTT